MTSDQGPAWSGTYIATGVLTWRRSRFAGVAFTAAIGLLLFPARLLVPGGQLFLPALAAVLLLAIVGYGYFDRVRETGA